MKSWSIVVRLFVFFGLVIAALAGGFALFMQADNLESRAIERREQLMAAVAAIRTDIIAMSDARLGLIIDPDNQAGRERRAAARLETGRSS